MRILTFDTESSTGRINDGSLCSIGYCVSDENFNITEQKDVIFHPLAKFRKGIIGQNGKVGLAYPEEEFYAADKFPSHYGYFCDLFKKCDFAVGFAIENDVKYLRDACNKFKLPQIEYKFIDVKGLLEIYDDEFKNKGLGAIAEALGEEFTAHRSDEDARLTLITLKYLCAKHKKTLKELLEYADVLCGSVTSKTYSHMYSFSQLYEKNGFKRTSRQSAYLFDHVLKHSIGTPRIDKTLFKKAFTFSKRIKCKEPNETLAVIKKIYELGGKYSDGMLSANVFVYENADDEDLVKASKIKETGRRITFITYDDLKADLGELKAEPFDYYEVIVKKEKERACKKSASKKTDKPKTSQKQ